MEVSYLEQTPTVEEYLLMRELGALSPKSKKGAEIGLKNSYYCISVRNKLGELVGMGRIIGDGGTAFQIVDVVTKPEYQKKGIGSKIMNLLTKYLETVDEKAYINLIADEKAIGLYKRYGFISVEPSIGMKWPRESK
ncbi:GNAT family N-acetyltransferase [Enterococcus sp. LJL99]